MLYLIGMSHVILSLPRFASENSCGTALSMPLHRLCSMLVKSNPKNPWCPWTNSWHSRAPESSWSSFVSFKTFSFGGFLPVKIPQNHKINPVDHNFTVSFGVSLSKYLKIISFLFPISQICLTHLLSHYKIQHFLQLKSTQKIQHFLHQKFAAPGDAILQRGAFLRAAPGEAHRIHGHHVATVAVVPVCRGWPDEAGRGPVLDLMDLEGSPGWFQNRSLYPLVMTSTAMENHHVYGENPLFLWPFSIAMLKYRRVAVF